MKKGIKNLLREAFRHGQQWMINVYCEKETVN